ncbi:DUF2334 domain-containing protein [Thermosyntropha sp.]|uniref:DUF2334 domain-containing protein n=1 Tax=Thermosyntropha sp. TaxID=2740820 RepID=UPI0025FA3EB8|nr:DUF2334 domain-containing protein [Thermosyntropha sp.]MBO8159575.1 DUF2334 domain-containing protein [Thermosyntropha sp.]
MFLLIWNSVCPPVLAEAEDETEVIILYEEPYRKDNQVFSLVDALYEYLGHFKVQFSDLAVEDWKSGILKDYQVVIYVGSRQRSLPESMLKELAERPAVIWLEDNIDGLAKFKGWNDFVYYGKSYYYVRLYAGKEEVAIDPYIPLYLSQPGTEAKVLASVSNLKDTLPLAWQRENVFYLGKFDFGFPFYILLADILHRVLPCSVSSSYNVLLRIEDVTPLTDPENLANLIDIIASYDIPYAVAVTPFDRHKGKETGLSQAKKLVKVLRKVRETGGFVIMHGCYHENCYSPETGEGFEFWNLKDEKPMEGEPDFTRQRLEKGLDEMAKSGIYPVAFEAPHYAMSSVSYRELSRYFSTYIGQIQLSDETYKASLEFPYVINSYRLNGMKVYPETLGYVDPQDIMSVEKIIQKARFQKILPHTETCVFYHGFLPPEGLDKLIKALNREGYKFISLGEEDFWVKGKALRVWGGKGIMRWESDITPINPDDKEPLYKGPKVVAKGITALALLITGLVLFFGIIVLNLRRKRNRLYEEG